MMNPDTLRAQGQALLDAASDYDAAGRAIGFEGESEPATFLRTRAAIFIAAAGAETTPAADDVALTEAVLDEMVKISTIYRMDGDGVRKMRELLIARRDRGALDNSNRTFASEAIRSTARALSTDHPTGSIPVEQAVNFILGRAAAVAEGTQK